MKIDENTTLGELQAWMRNRSVSVTFDFSERGFRAVVLDDFGRSGVSGWGYDIATAIDVAKDYYEAML